MFPAELKIARVIQLYNGDNNQLIHNHRPISALPFFSRIFEEEKLFKYVLRFLDDNNIMYEYHFGFRKYHSTNHAIIKLVERVPKALDTGKYIVGVFLDLKKSFDTVDHCILLNKLEKYEMRGNLLYWFKSYLSFRGQFVEYNDCHSDKKYYTWSAPRIHTRAHSLHFIILITFLNHLIYCFQYYLQMKQVCSLRELHISVS